MDKKPKSELDPQSEAGLKDWSAAYDDMRHRYSVGYSEYLNWALSCHEDRMRVLLDHNKFSSVVSNHPSVSHRMDSPQHATYRRIGELYFNVERMRAFEPACRAIAMNLAYTLPDTGETELMSALAEEYALQVPSAFLGWTAELPVNTVYPAVRLAALSLRVDRSGAGHGTVASGR